MSSLAAHPDGLYVQPGGTSGPGCIIAMWWALPGIIGARMANAITSEPTIVSLA